MNGIWVGLSVAVSESDVGSCLGHWFPGLEMMTLDEAYKTDRLPWPPIVYWVDRHHAADFPTYLSFDCFPGPESDPAAAGAVLARRLSDWFQCRALCDGSGFGDDGSPYWSMSWEGGRVWLADDSNTDFADGEGGPVRIVRALDLPAWNLDRDGSLVRPRA